MRRRSLAAALIPTVRTAPLLPAAATVVLGGAPLVVASCRSGASSTTPWVLAALVAGAAIGWAADDPAAELLAPAPIPSPTRTVVRVAGVAMVAVAVLAAVVAVVALGPGLPPGIGDRSLEALAAAAVALAAGLVVGRRGEPQPGALGVVAGVLVPVLVVGVAVRWPGALPTFTAGPVHDRWLAVVVVGLLAAMRAGRDAARP